MHLKKALILNFSGDVDDYALDNLISCLELNSIETTDEHIDELSDLKGILERNTETFDYLFIASHGDKDKAMGSCDLEINWQELTLMLCNNPCLTEDSILMLFCCHGGLKTIAYKIFNHCPQIKFVCGAKYQMRNIDLAMGFNTFLFNRESKYDDPIIAAQKATNATGREFICHAKDELENDPAYQNYCIECLKVYETPLILSVTPTPN